MSISETISMSIVLLYGIPIILYFYTNNVIHLKAFIGLVGTTTLSEFIKHFYIKDYSPRPVGAANCNLLCNNGNQEGKPGMPSSHSATVAFFTAFYYWQTQNEFVRSGLIGYNILIMLSRYIMKCHTIPQIMVGTMLGIGMSQIVVRHL
jgi:membrane-associated phospholipid phosphatase